MKILFVCKGNVGRSQIAEGIFNKLSKKNYSSFSAGLKPGRWEGKKIKDIKKVFLSLKEIDCDVGGKISKKLTKYMVDDADKIIVLGEKENWPDYLKKSNKVMFWDVEDPKGRDLEFHRKIRDKIYPLVKKLIRKIDKDL